ncbi:MAG: Gfo/Idh/MocA family oxidoreductase [Oscillospiraceae bacterium]|nr:Gfo/Idh/MocA family oxidoreductase [Oscillospiraceae bacterium]
MERKLRLAVIGTSDIAVKLVTASRKCESVEIAAVYSRTAEKGNEFANTFGIPDVFTDLEELAKASDIDAVYVASPNLYHFEQSVLMMQHGKHVLCEKPIATSADAFSQMLDIAKGNGVVLTEATRFFHAPGLKKLRELMPEIGTVRRASLLFNQYSSKYEALKAGEIPNTFNKDLAGGALMDLGVYCIELMVALFGEPHEIVSSALFVHSGADGQGAVIAKYDGLLAELSYSKISQASVPSLIQGEEGSLLFTKASIIDKIDVVKRNGETEQIVCYTDENDMFYELQAFADMIETPQKADEFNNYTMLAQRVMDEIKRQTMPD